MIRTWILAGLVISACGVASASNEVLQAFWAWHADGDPTLSDHDANGVGDWVTRSTNPFATSNLSVSAEGRTVWSSIVVPGETLDTAPTNAFNGTRLEADVWWESFGSGGFDAVFWINLDYQPAFYLDQVGAPSNATFAPVYASLKTNGTTQVLELHNVQNPGWNDVVIATITNLPPGMLHMHWTVLPDSNTVSIAINGVPRGTYGYVPRMPQNNDAFASLVAGNGRFDRVIIQHYDTDVPPAVSSGPARGLLLQIE